MQNNTSSFGLTKEDLSKIIQVLKAFPEVQRGVIFGSRALGTYKRGSDIDIALFGKNLNSIITRISYELNEELVLPYFFDLVDYNSISNQQLKEHIDRVGLLFYQK
jgi:predicted nucleotidyltransferase